MRGYAIGVLVLLPFASGDCEQAEAGPPRQGVYPNFVKNPGFEHVTGPVPVGWQDVRKEGLSMSKAAHSGDWCVALGSPNREWSVIQQDITLIPGQDYVLSFWYRSEKAGAGKPQIRPSVVDPRQSPGIGV